MYIIPMRLETGLGKIQSVFLYSCMIFPSVIVAFHQCINYMYNRIKKHTFLLIIMLLKCQRCVSTTLETNNVTCTMVFTSGRYFRNEFLTSLRSHPTLRFSHSILQETTYGILVADQRRVLHEGAAEHLHIRYDRSLN